ncbi:hypothetical protein [Agaribacter marinus]|uniref:Uncharacterized protein n=1 Tax=Agaribacter marinus TaxID=1431249 RepID=A0AA37WFV1_9ALTE|nr:hypothetical protein [Agaribacter marinus]GLR69361.1 hypothetical protein GCM10007852_02690 [Agaribacter marinus]
MRVFELRGGGNGYMTFVAKNEIDLYQDRFADMKNYSETMSKEPPNLILGSATHNQKKYKGKPLKIADIGYLVAGNVIVNERVRETIGDYLKQFGDLIPINVEGNTWYSYVVTNVLDGITDIQKSVLTRSGRLKIPAFDIQKLPRHPQIFKTKETGLLQIFFTETETEGLRSLINIHGIDAGDMKLVWESK